ncbi:MAG TPA: class I SAM-dependent methyltransferase [Candidatus Binatia bacterium]|nr:class I SAM-dependent methyltransferase [Candidatus Binatia bacterium]
MNWINGKLAIARAIHLDLTHPQVLYGRALRRYVRPGVKWLDVGCGYQILPDWAMPLEEQRQLVSSAAMLTGADVDIRIKDHPLLTYRVEALGGALPFRDQSFDLVTANMVVEHVEDARSFLADIHRVLRPGGRFLFHTPNILFWLMLLAYITPEFVKKPIIWKVEQRAPEDVFPTRYRMNTPWRIERLAREAGFTVEELTMAGSSRIFDRLGPIGWAECLVQKGMAAFLGGRLNSNIIAALKRT